VGESKTHFEQIPVEVVKKIATKLPAREFPEDYARDEDTEDISTEDRVTSPEERGRKVAQTVRQESNPQEMIGLVQEPIATFDDERKSPPHTRRPKQSSDSGQDQS
jgi:hypothetical protein